MRLSSAGLPHLAASLEQPVSAYRLLGLGLLGVLLYAVWTTKPEQD